MKMGKALVGNPYEGKLHGRLDEGIASLTEAPRCRTRQSEKITGKGLLIPIAIMVICTLGWSPKVLGQVKEEPIPVVGIPLPRPVEIELVGEPCVPEFSEKGVPILTETGEQKKRHFLVAGSNATAIVTLDHYYPTWQPYLSLFSDIQGIQGYVRHTLKEIRVYGYAARVDPDDGQIANYGDDYTTAARKDFVFTYSLRLDSTDNDNREKYRIVAVSRDMCCLDLHGIKEADLTTGINGVFKLPMMLPTGLGYHGQFYWSAAVAFHDEYMGFDGAEFLSGGPIGEIDYDTEDPAYWQSGVPAFWEEGATINDTGLLLANETGRIFFDKYGQDNAGTPNWFTYWKEDGACPCLSMSNIVLDPTLSGYGEARGSANEIAINPRMVAETHYGEVCRVSRPQTHDFSGPHIWGIYSVEEVVAHENQHLKLHSAYWTYYEEYNKSSGWARLPDWMLDKQKDSDRHFDSVTQTKKEYWESPFPIETRNGICDFKRIEYCDHLRDVEENSSPYLFDSMSTDTYNLAAVKNPEYTAYGDDEFLAMMAANKATKEWRAVLTNDWAFPGEQSYVPASVSACRAGLEYTQPNNWPNGWNPPELRHVATVANQSMPKCQLVSSAKGIHLVKNSVDEDPSITIDGISKNIEYDADDGLVSAICYGIGMTVKGLNELHLNGTIVDKGGHAIAYANAIVSNGVRRAELRFDGKSVYESAGEGPYRLGQISLVEFSGIDYSELATLSEFTDSEVDLRREDFARNGAYLLDVVGETVTTNGIEVSVDMEVSAAGEYGLVATLVNTNGTPVASCSMSANCAQGTNRVNMVFAASAILQSGVDGPYDIDNIALFRDGGRVDSRLHFYSLRKKYQSQAFDFDEDASFDSSQFMSQFEDYTPPAELSPPEWFWVFFNPNGGTVSETAREVVDGDKVGTLPIPTLENDEFLGWYTELEGGTRITDSTIVTTNMMCHARWKNGGAPDPVPTQQAWTVTFNANGGTVSPATRQVAGGSAVGTLPTATRSGYTLVGWFTAASGGTQVSASTKVTANVTYYAHWAQNGGGDGPGGETGPSGAPTLFAAGHAETPFAGDATYNGWVRNKDGTIAGLLTVKAGKAAKPEKGGQSKLTVNYTPFGGRKQTIKLDNAAMPAAGGVATVEIPGVGTVKFTGDAIVGVDVDVQAAKDALKSKDRAEKAAATAFAAGKAGTWTFALGTDAGYAAFTATVDKKGKGKLAGTLPDGTKVSVSAQGILGDGVLAIPFAYAKKGSLGFVFWVKGDGTAELSDLTGALGNRALPEVSVVAPSAAHRLSDGEHTFTAGGISQGFAVAGKKWDVPRQNKKADPDPNPTGLKLAFTEKTGAVKGAFTVADGKAKTKYTVVGVVVGGKLYGAAYARNVGSMPATAE